MFPILMIGFLPSPSSNPNKIGNCVHTGANVNAKDTLWLTPLHRAAASRNEVQTLPHFTLSKGWAEGLEKLRLFCPTQGGDQSLASPSCP